MAPLSVRTTTQNKDELHTRNMLHTLMVYVFLCVDLRAYRLRCDYSHVTFAELTARCSRFVPILIRAYASFNNNNNPCRTSASLSSSHVARLSDMNRCGQHVNRLTLRAPEKTCTFCCSAHSGHVANFPQS